MIQCIYRCFIFFLILVWLNPLSLKADEVKFSAKSSHSLIEVGERFQITYSLNTSGNSFRPPTFSDFRVVSGPNQSTSMQWINGAMTQSISFSYVLVAPNTGTYTIPAATIQVNGKQYSSESIKIEVVKGSGSSAQNNATPNQNRPQNSTGNSIQSKSSNASVESQIKENIYLKVLVDKRKVFLGEQIVANYKIYTRVDVLNNQTTKLPALTGFWNQDIDINGPVTLQREVVDGVPFNVAELKKTILFPQRLGILEIDPLEMECVVRVQSSRQARTIFDQFFGAYEDLKVTIKSNPIKVEVLPLPEANKPSSFTGAVGNFNFSHDINKTEVKANDAITLKLKIQGTGNLKLIQTPKIEFPTDFEVYDPKINDQIKTEISGVSGTRVFEYLIIPRHPGNYTLENIKFSYFNFKNGSYKEIVIDPIAIKVDKSNESEQQILSANYAQKEDIKVIGNDIMHIKKQSSSYIQYNDFFIKSPFFYILYLLFFGLGVSIIVWIRKQQKLNADFLYVKTKKAGKIAIKRLVNAKKEMDAGNNKLFYEEIFKAIYGYISDKFQIPYALLNKDFIKEKLIEHPISEEEINRLVYILNQCEMARFAPGSVPAPGEIYNLTAKMIEQLETLVKK
jgi:hypothetical protein